MRLLIDALIPFASTFSGVFLAFVLGVLWQRHQRTQEEKRLRLETKDALFTELGGIHGEVLDIFAALRARRDMDDIPDMDFPTDAKESAVTSGRFTLLEVPLQTEVSHVYAVIRQAIDYRSGLLPPRGVFRPDPYPKIFEQFQERLHHLNERIPPLVIALAPK